MANKLGSLLIQLAADTSLLQRDMGRAVGIVNRGAAGFTRAASVARSALAGIGVGFGVAAIARSLKHAVDEIDNLSKAAQKFGVPIAELQALKHASELADVSFEKLGVGVVRLSKNLFDASQGIGKTGAIFDAIGVSAVTAAGAARPVADVIEDVADAFTRLEDGSTKTALAVTLFGKSGAALIPLLNGGSAGIRAAADELRKYGIELDEASGAQAEEFNDNLKRLGVAASGLGHNIAVELLPSLLELTETLNRFTQNGGAVQKAAQGIAFAIGHIGDAAKLAAGFFVGGVLGGPLGAAAGTAVAGASILSGPSPPVSISGKIERRRPAGLDAGAIAATLKAAKGQEAAANAAASAEKSRLASIQSTIDGLKEQQATLGKSESALVAYKLQALGATKAQVDFAVALSKANAIQEIIDALEKEGETLGLTGVALTEYQLSLNGASQAQIDFATAIARSNIAKQNDLDILEKEKTARQELSDKIKQIRDEAITGLMDEVTAIRVAEGLKVEEVIRGVEERVITEREAAAIIANIHTKAGKDAAEALKKTTEGIGEFALEAARQIQNALGDQLFNILQGNYENIGDQFKATLDRMVADALAAQLAKKMFGDFDKTSKIGGWVGKVFGVGGESADDGAGAAAAAATAGAAATAAATQQAAAAAAATLSAGATAAATALSTGGTVVSTALGTSGTLASTALGTGGAAAGTALATGGAAAASAMIAGATSAAAILSAGSSGSSGLSLLSSFGGVRAEGGPVAGGTTYLVGERGPEMFVPKGNIPSIGQKDFKPPSLPKNNADRDTFDPKLFLPKRALNTPAFNAEDFNASLKNRPAMIPDIERNFKPENLDRQRRELKGQAAPYLVGGTETVAPKLSGAVQPLPTALLQMRRQGVPSLAANPYPTGERGLGPIFQKGPATGRVGELSTPNTALPTFSFLNAEQRGGSMPYLVGAGGPEMFVPKVSGDILPLDPKHFNSPRLHSVRQRLQSAISDIKYPMGIMSLPKREHGGPVMGGSPYLVGERGPEMFVPRGTVTSNDHSSGDKNVSLTINVSGITDARGIREASGHMAARAGAQVQRALARNT